MRTEQFGAVRPGHGAIVSGETVGNAVNDPKNAIAELVAKEADDKKVIEEVFMRVLNRSVTDIELKSSLELLTEINTDHEQLKSQLNAAEQRSARSWPSGNKSARKLSKRLRRN